MPSRRDSLLARALLEADQRYGPQGAALRSLLSERAQEYDRTRRVLASNARGIVAATQQARPEMSQAFDQALATAQAARGALGTPQGDPQAAAYTRRVSEARAHALNALSDRATQAEEGRIYGGQTARREYLADKRKIGDQLLGLLGQSGAFVAARRGELADEAASRGIDRRRIAETERHNRAAEATARAREVRQARGPQRAPTRIKWASQEQHAKARDLIEEAVGQVRDLRQDTQSRAEIIALLIKGVPASKLPDGTTVPPIPKLPPDYARAATNLVFDKTLSRGDVARLHNRRLRIRSLGYPTRKGGATAPRSAAQLAATGQPSMSSRPPVALR